MALVEHWRTDFDSDAKTGKWFFSPAPGGLAHVADVRRTTFDGTSCISINIGDEVPTVEYFSDATGDAYGKMVADVGAQANGAVAYCYSTDSSKHGRYQKAGGAWGARTGETTAPLADDTNHQARAQIRLGLQSWSEAADAYAVNDGPGALVDKLGLPDFAVLNAAVGRPAVRDLSGWIMRWRLRAVQMQILDRSVKWGQHFQTRIPSAPLVGSYNGVGAPLFVNAINTATCISDALGFGNDGFHGLNAVTYVADSGWVDIDIPLEPLDSYWYALGGNDGAAGTDAEKMGRPPYTKSLRYGNASAKRWGKNWSGNAYMVEARFNPNPDQPLPPVPAASSTRGRLLAQSVSLLREA